MVWTLKMLTLIQIKFEYVFFWFQNYWKIEAEINFVGKTMYTIQNKEKSVG